MIPQNRNFQNLKKICMNPKKKFHRNQSENIKKLFCNNLPSITQKNNYIKKNRYDPLLESKNFWKEKTYKEKTITTKSSVNYNIINQAKAYENNFFNTKRKSFSIKRRKGLTKFEDFGPKTYSNYNENFKVI